MHIPSHQIHNVLKVYSKQLSQTRMLERQRELDRKQPMDNVNISAEAKRQSIIDKVAADIVERITQSGPQDDVEKGIIDKLEGELGKSVSFNSRREDKFVFNVINSNNEKTTNTLEVENSMFLIKRLEQLAKEAVDKNMEL
jgi:hypothetical protein